MSKRLKNQKEILTKLGIEQLNPMQEEAHLAIHSTENVMLLSPTGTGKTIAFLLPIIRELDMENPEVQALIVVPSRELAIQIEQVARDMGTGSKINAVYGGRHFSKDKMDLHHRPAILIGTPGRLADHLRRGTFSADEIKTAMLTVINSQWHQQNKQVLIKNAVDSDRRCAEAIEKSSQKSAGKKIDRDTDKLAVNQKWSGANKSNIVAANTNVEDMFGASK